MGAFGLQSITSFLEISSRNTSSVPSRIPLIKFSVNSFLDLKKLVNLEQMLGFHPRIPKLMHRVLEDTHSNHD
jgi:hypothetical protein